MKRPAKQEPGSPAGIPPTLNIFSSIRLILLAFAFAFCANAWAQEIPRPSISRAASAAPSLARPYNLKIGPIAFTAFAGLGLEFVDNLNLTSTEKSGDLVLRPSVGITAAWQVTKLNSLELRTTLGYAKYLQHPELDTHSALISPDSEIRLNVFVGDVKIVLHEQFSLEEDPVGSGVNGVAKLGRFTNTIGATLLWDLNDVIWSLGYDHFNFITTGNTANTNGSLNANLSSLDHSTDQVSSSVMLKLTPTTGLGLEGTASYSFYPKNERADSTVYGLGPFLDVQLTRYTHLTLGGGYQLYTSKNGGDSAPAPEFLTASSIPGVDSIAGPQRSGSSPRPSGDGSGYYFNLALTHRLNRFYQDRLTLGREFQVGLLSDRTVTTFVAYTSQWTFNQRLSLTASARYENVEQTRQFADAFQSGALSNYQVYSAALSTSYQLTKKLNVAVSYQFTKRTADLALQEYSQNRLALQFGYQF